MRKNNILTKKDVPSLYYYQKNWKAIFYIYIYFMYHMTSKFPLNANKLRSSFIPKLR